MRCGRAGAHPALLFENSAVHCPHSKRGGTHTKLIALPRTTHNKQQTHRHSLSPSHSTHTPTCCRCRLSLTQLSSGLSAGQPALSWCAAPWAQDCWLCRESAWAMYVCVCGVQTIVLRCGCAGGALALIAAARSGARQSALPLPAILPTVPRCPCLAIYPRCTPISFAATCSAPSLLPEQRIRLFPSPLAAEPAAAPTHGLCTAAASTGNTLQRAASKRNEMSVCPTGRCRSTWQRVGDSESSCSTCGTRDDLASS